MRYILIQILLLQFTLIISQSNSFKSKFTIIEKNEITAKQHIVKGIVVYDKSRNKTTMEINFPEKQTWILQDSFLTKYIEDTIVSKSTVGKLDDISIFKELLNVKSNDFGLKEIGFTEGDITKVGSEIYVQWNPPRGYDKFISKATTLLKNNLLIGVSITDIENKDISTIFFEDHIIINGYPVPKLVKQHVRGQQLNIYKIIKFSDVEID